VVKHPPLGDTAGKLVCDLHTDETRGRGCDTKAATTRHGKSDCRSKQVADEAVRLCVAAEIQEGFLGRFDLP
jgi:hypothetical protein